MDPVIISYLNISMELYSVVYFEYSTYETKQNSFIFQRKFRTEDISKTPCFLYLKISVGLVGSHSVPGYRLNIIRINIQRLLKIKLEQNQTIPKNKYNAYSVFAENSLI